MDGYGIETKTGRLGPSRYRREDADRWELDEAARTAINLLDARHSVYVSIGNGDHEFRLWGPDADASNIDNFTSTPTGPRWAPWYLDVEIEGRRWVYRPLSDFTEYEEAFEVIEEKVYDLFPTVTRVWLGRSDGSETHTFDDGGMQDKW